MPRKRCAIQRSASKCWVLLAIIWLLPIMPAGAKSTRLAGTAIAVPNIADGRPARQVFRNEVCAIASYRGHASWVSPLI